MSKKLLLNKGSYNYFVFDVDAGKTIELIDDSYNSITDWGDGSSNTSTSHTYKHGGKYTVTTKHRINYANSLISYNRYTVSALIECLGVMKNIDLRNMFRDCNRLTKADISSIEYNPQSAQSLSYTFCSCSSLETIVFPEKIRINNLRGTFSSCSKLESIDTSCFELTYGSENNFGFDISGAFSGCSSLKSLNLSWLRGAYDRITDLSHMFSGCKSLTSLDLTPIDTGRVLYFSYMFMGCESLTSLNINGWKMKMGLDTYATKTMFVGCKSLILDGIYMINCDENVKEHITNAINNK
jgi:surface protein